MPRLPQLVEIVDRVANACYFLLNYAILVLSEEGQYLINGDLLFSFELCWGYIKALVLLEELVFASCYFLLNYAASSQARRCRTHASSTPCYFLLNYAGLRRRSGLLAQDSICLLFSFELCLPVPKTGRARFVAKIRAKPLLAIFF